MLRLLLTPAEFKRLNAGAGTRYFQKEGFLVSVGFNQATSQSFRVVRASLQSTEESAMLIGLDFVSHVTLLPLRSIGFSAIVIHVAPGASL